MKNIKQRHSILNVCLFSVFNLISSVSFAEWENGPIPPANAVVAGHVSSTPFPIYVCRVYERNNVHAGKVAFSNNSWNCYIGNGGVEQKFNQYEVFVQRADSAYDYSWSSLVNNKMLDNAVVAGHVSDTPQPVYVCRIYERDNIHAGKAAFYNGRWSCFIGNGGGEQRFETYDLLIQTLKSRPSAEVYPAPIPATNPVVTAPTETSKQKDVTFGDLLKTLGEAIKESNK
jgi:hypothetical protein